MSNTIQIKRSSTSGSAPEAGELAQGELAINLADEALFTKDASNAVVKLNAPSIDDKNTGATKHVTIDSVGKVGIGTSSPSNRLSFGANIGRYFALYEGAAGADMYGIGTETSGLTFKTAATERARIDSSGSLLVGRTSGLGSSRLVVESSAALGVNPMTVSNTSPNVSGDYAIIFYRNGSIVGSVQTTLSATQFVTSSDYRLKHDIQPMTGALARVAALKPCTYKWNADNSEDEGFIAHELAEVCPSAVSGEKDAVNEDGSIKPQGIDTSFLVAPLTAAIQELKAINDAQAQTIDAQQTALESLTARVVALEGN